MLRNPFIALSLVVTFLPAASAQETQPSPPPARKHPVPDEQARKNALKLLKTIFEDDYAKTKPEDLAKLASELAKQAVETKDEPATQYVMYLEAQGIAVRAGDVETASAAARQMAEAFQIDALRTKAETIVGLSKSTRSAAQSKAFVQAAIEVIDEAIAADDYPLAREIAQLARRAVFRARDKALRQELETRTGRIAELSRAYSEHQKVLKTLEANPVDPGQTDRTTYRPAPPPPGLGFGLTTYMGDGSPLPAFAGDPLLLPLRDTAQDTLDAYWDALDADNRVALAVKQILCSGEASEILVRNRF